MTVAEFQDIVKVSPAAKRIELPPEDYADLSADLWPGLTPLEFIYEGITVAPGFSGMICASAPGWSHSWTVDKKKSKSSCDCGAAKTNQPGHSHWCTSQQVSA